MNAKKALEKIQKAHQKRNAKDHGSDKQLGELLAHPLVSRLYTIMDDAKKGKPGAAAAGDEQLLRTLLVMRGITDMVIEEVGTGGASELLARTDRALDYAIDGTPIS